MSTKHNTVKEFSPENCWYGGGGGEKFGRVGAQIVLFN